ncbi:EF-hand domain-containing protein [Belnapia rosea]|uniref:EF-hand domain pair n=1 Tax=Belnapia rosea TaxID=938405 RepID=A0A1G6YM98_9PROT|nr:EF-hand domain-containing protein [Belnapia rosea]SDD91103.1 EF-hand domain pair [Belnapia rosea]
MQVSASGSAGNAAMIQQMRERMFSRADKDGDGSLTLDEFQPLARPAASAGTGAMDATFKALDADGDGRLSSAEMAQARPHRHGGGRMGTGADGMATLLGVQESSQGQSPGGIEAVMARMLRAYGGKVGAA